MTRTDIPDDVVAAMRAVAGGAPSYPGDLQEVQRRGRARRRRQATAATGFAAVAVAAAVAVPSIVSGQGSGPVAAPPVTESQPAPEAPAEPAQRLLIDGAGWVRLPGEDGGTEARGADSGETARAAYERYRELPGAVGVLGELGELRPDGEVVPLDLDLPGIDSVRDVVAMPDGRLAAIGVVDLMPGVERDDGPCVEGVDFPLLVIEADGSVSLSREVRVMCESLRLVAADADTAYLARDSRLVAHDLATGEERTLVESPYPLDGGFGSVAGGRVATVIAEPWDRICAADRVEDQFVVRLSEFESGASSAHRMPLPGCVGYPGGLRLSPDGRYAAVVLDRRADDDSYYALGVAVLDLDTGDVVLDQTVIEAHGDHLDLTVEMGRNYITSTPGAIAGIAWDDERTLRVAWYEVPEAGVHWMADLVQASTFPVP